MSELAPISKKKPGRPRKPCNWTAETLTDAAEKYFEKCDSKTKYVVTKEGVEKVPAPAPYSIEGLCCFISVLRRDFYLWRKRGDELGEAAEMIHQMITANRIEGALEGTQNHAFAQFLLKNNAPESYRDKIELENSISQEAATMFNEWSGKWKEMKSDLNSGD